MHQTRYKSLYQLLGFSITISITFPCLLCSTQDESYYANCSQAFKCGDPNVLGDLKFPFWGINRGSYCGKPGFELKCVNNTLLIANSASNLQVISTDPQFHKITVALADFRNNLCPSVVLNKHRTNTSFLNPIAGNPYMVSNIRVLTILYGCPSELGHQLSWSEEYSCSIKNTTVGVHYVTDTVNATLTLKCTSVVSLLIQQQTAESLDDKAISLNDSLDQGFEMKYFMREGNKCDSCTGSGGECGYDLTANQFICYCPDNTYPLACPPLKQGHRQPRDLIAASIAAAIGIVMLGIFIYFSKNILQKCKPKPTNQSVEACLRNYASHVLKRYTYKNIKKITKSFKEKLGEGGYGTVFKGNLQDGRAVAVKVWKKSKGDGQEFLNEVMSISGTSHVSIVPLLGFCFEGHKRALIYDFMPNGSLEKFIHGRDINDNYSLSSHKLFDIAVGIGRGLEYLHRGCNTRIVHFDIKPHNILLDAEFTPKISDFGLAKSLKKKESIISMSGARGTAGYIAPEVILRSFGGVSHKSDVYSFGMMVLEMVGCKKRGNHIAENSSEMYFPRWIYKQLEQEASTVDSDRILNEEEKELERIMILVGLWCIQTNPLSRPPMSRVVNMLEGKVELLEIPPMPTLASLPRQQQPADDDSTTLIVSSTASSIIDHSHSMQIF